MFRTFKTFRTCYLETLPEMILVFFKYCFTWWPRIKKLLLDCLCDSLWSNFKWNKLKSHGKLSKDERSYI